MENNMLVIAYDQANPEDGIIAELLGYNDAGNSIVVRCDNGNKVIYKHSEPVSITNLTESQLKQLCYKMDEK